MSSKAIKIYKEKAYIITDKILKEYENKQIHFEDHEGNKAVPSIFGRAGDGFNVTFKNAG